MSHVQKGAHQRGGYSRDLDTLLTKKSPTVDLLKAISKPYPRQVHHTLNTFSRRLLEISQHLIQYLAACKKVFLGEIVELVMNVPSFSRDKHSRQ